MAVKIRLMRTGRRNMVSYRIVVAEARSPRDGRFIEAIGYYNISKGGELTISEERLDYWLKVGAKLTERVGSLVKLYKKKGGNK